MVDIRSERAHGPARRAIMKGLRTFNTEKAGTSDFQSLTLTVRHRGEVVGGLAAETYYGWMFISLLWIDEKHRRAGVGRSLIDGAEAEARARGVERAYVDTFSFQAPGFYKKLGYRQFAKLDDFPQGYSRFWLTKTL